MDRPWVDKQGRAVVRDSSGKIVVNPGKCALCGRDAANVGDYADDKGRPLPRNAQGKQVGTDRHGNVFDDKGLVVKTRTSAVAPIVVDENGTEVK